MDRSDLIPVLFLILMIVVVLPSFLGPPLYLMIIMLTLHVALFFGFSFTHGYQTLGGKTISVFFGITFVVTYVMEWLGTHFGILFGHYYYTNQLGPLLMDVPVVIPVQWFNMLYVCYIMANIILIRNNDGASASISYQRILLSSVVVGLFMVSWDFINDPYMVGVGSWVWTDPMEFFGLTFQGIPLSNFLGWVLTSALTILLLDLYRRQDRESVKKFMDNITEPINGLILVPYLFALVIQTISGITAGVFSFSIVTTLVPIGLALVCMGLATVLTGWRFLQLRRIAFKEDK
jgi:uncharacterized membrane protein